MPRPMVERALFFLTDPLFSYYLEEKVPSPHLSHVILSHLIFFITFLHTTGLAEFLRKQSILMGSDATPS